MVFCKARIVLQLGRHVTVMRSVNVKQLPQRECWTLHRGDNVMLMGSRNGPIHGLLYSIAINLGLLCMTCSGWLQILVLPLHWNLWLRLMHLLSLTSRTVCMSVSFCVISKPFELEYITSIS